MELGQVFTKRKIADFMVSLFSNNIAEVLDPCFGQGVFINSLLENMECNIVGYEIDKILFQEYKNSIKSNRVKLFNSDFLQGTVDQKFDGIILNPPYIRHEKINDMKSIWITKTNLLKQPIFSKLPQTSNFYMYFIIKCLYLLKDNGQMIVIFPNSWKGSKNEEIFLELISSKASIIEEYYVKGDAFEQDALVDVLILKIVKRTKLKKEVSQNIIINDNDIITRIDNNKKKHIDFQFSKILTDYSVTRRGITTGANKIFINPRISCSNNHVYNIISSPKQIEGYNTRKCNFDKILFIKQDDIPTEEEESYLKQWEDKINSDKKPVTLYNKIENKQKWYILKEFETEGIIFGYIIRENVKFILNELDIMVRDNFYIIRPKIDKYLLISLLNNYYIYLQLEIKGKRYGKGVLKIQKYDIDDLKLPDINKINDQDIRSLKTLGYELCKTNRDSAEVINLINHIISKYSNIKIEQVTQLLEAYTKDRLES